MKDDFLNILRWIIKYGVKNWENIKFIVSIFTHELTDEERLEKKFW